MKDRHLEIHLTINSSELPLRIDRFLRDYLSHHEDLELSRTELKQLFEEQKVLLSGLPASASTLLKPGVLKIQILDLPEKTIQYASPALTLHAEVLYEDSHLLILNKPSGLPSVPHSSAETETAVGVALAHSPGLQSIGRTPLEPGLLHRLDTETSGVLVFAKTQAEFDRLLLNWKTPHTQKIYRALVEGFSPLPQTLPYPIDSPLGHDLKSKRKMRVATPDQLYRIRGKPLPARTDLLRVQAVKHPQIQTPHPLFDLTLQIHTGVMHQIRTHLSALHWPILGDPLYHPSSRKSPQSNTRLWLHAWKIKLPLSSGETLEITAPLPAGWPTPS